MSNLRINKVGVLSAAKLQGVIGLVIGLIIGVIYALIFIIYALFGAALIPGNDAKLAVGGGGIVIAVVALIMFPIIYAIIGFIGGLIGALLYNLFAGLIGGIELEVENF